MTENERRAWELRNEAVTRLARNAAEFRWPEAVLDEAPEPSETRTTLQQIRETYQRTMRIRLQAYREYRNQGNAAAATTQANLMLASTRSMQRHVADMTRLFSRTYFESLSRNLAEAVDYASAGLEDAASTLRAAAPALAAGSGVALVLVAVGALWYFSRKR